MAHAVHLPDPHPKQHAFVRSGAKRKIVVAGRRGGKTTGAAILAVEAMICGRRVLEAAPTADQTTAFWEACKRALAEPLAAGVVRKNETERLLELPRTRGIPVPGRIRAKTAWDADTLRGDYADLLILDEYALMDPSAWDAVGAPMLLDNDGDAVFISTPRRKNHFHRLYARALGDDTGRWEAWHFSSHDNPHLSPEALAEITRDMTQEAYRQEILAEFLEGEGAVFRNIRSCLGAPLHAAPEAHARHELVAGCDWGQVEDYTAVSVVCRECRVEVARERVKEIDYHLQRQSLVGLVRKWGVGVLYGESNAMGLPILAELAHDPALRGVRIVPFQTTPSSKPPLIESLRLCFEREECQWQEDPVWTGELEAYEVRYSAVTGRPTYSAPEGVHDDTVVARALAWRAATDVVGLQAMPGPYAEAPEAPATARERRAHRHADTPLHRAWAKKHYCPECAREWDRQMRGEEGHIAPAATGVPPATEMPPAHNGAGGPR